MNTEQIGGFGDKERVSFVEVISGGGKTYFTKYAFELTVCKTAAISS